MISVVIPLYNKAATIARAVGSVQAQTFADWELIVVDDGSTDAGPDWVARSVDPRVRLHRQANAGVSAARNQGIELARSDFVALLDADDYWDRGHLANMQDLIGAFPGAALYACAYHTVYSAGRVRKVNTLSWRPERSLLTDYFADAVLGEPPVWTGAVVVSRAALQAVGGFPLRVTSGEDLITWARLACAGPVAYSTEATSYYNLPPAVASVRQHLVRRPQTPDYVGQALQGLMAEYPQRAASLRAYLAVWMHTRAMLYLELNERLECLRALREAVALSRPQLKDVIVGTLLLLPDGPRRWVLARIRRLRGRA